jgi:hypothetical protein
MWLKTLLTALLTTSLKTLLTALLKNWTRSILFARRKHSDGLGSNYFLNRKVYRIHNRHQKTRAYRCIGSLSCLEIHHSNILRHSLKTTIFICLIVRLTDGESIKKTMGYHSVQVLLKTSLKASLIFVKKLFLKFVLVK